MIQLPIYNGENHHNNKVILDFFNKTVRFEPVYTGSLLKIWYAFFYLLFFKTIFHMGWIFIIWMLIFRPEKYIYQPVGLVIVELMLMIPFLFSLIVFNEKWRHNYYPKINAYLLNNRKKKQRVNPDSIINNIFAIHHFDNVLLEYELSGDYSEYIKDIRIDNKFEGNPDNWYAIFEFIKKPIKGDMYLKYI